MRAASPRCARRCPTSSTSLHTALALPWPLLEAVFSLYGAVDQPIWGSKMFIYRKIFLTTIIAAKTLDSNGNTRMRSVCLAGTVLGPLAMSFFRHGAQVQQFILKLRPEEQSFFYRATHGHIWSSMIFVYHVEKNSIRI